VREREPPPALLKALEAMSGYLRAMRLGDGSLACFNGMGPTPLDALATMLTIETGSAFSPLAASGYVRATAGDLVLVMDCGKAPPAEHSAEAQAGCLSFELSDGPSALLVNTGFPAQGSPAEIAVARAGTSHNTLTLDGRSSARMVTHTPLGLVAERAALAGPPGITHALAASADGTTITASHEGYLTSHQLVHTRRLVVATSGDLVTGVDRVGGRQGSVRLRKDIPVAIRFHLAPGCLARPVGDTLAAIEIATSHGKLWQLTVEGAETFVEPSVVYGHHASARPSQQIVLRASTNGDTTVSWALARTK
jgi:uncharacterized heparinase superfamily protein